ncbi:MAG TPA: hypothetical protein VGM90_15535 [Kofleriaceae bacterium]|jgi:hypothetical protein
MTRVAAALALAVASLAACAKPSQTRVEQPRQSGNTDSYWLCHDSRFQCEPADLQLPADKIVPDQGIQVDTNLWQPGHRSNLG